MKFAMIIANRYAMKKLFVFIFAAVCIITFTAAGKPGSSDSNDRNEKKLAKQEKVKEAVESRSFAIELDRLYMSRFGSVNLTPDRNYIIIRGNNAAVRAGYMGRQFGLTPVAGIHLSGKPSVYKMQKNDSKGNYKIEMEVTSGSDTFHIFMTISENGYCSALISGIKIDDVRYSGSLVPIVNEKKSREPDAIRL